VFAPGKPFQLSVMFVGKARSLELSTWKVLYLGWLWPYSVTLLWNQTVYLKVENV